MGLADKLNSNVAKFDLLESRVTSLPDNVRGDVLGAVTSIRGMSTSLPSQMTGFYDNFTSNIKAISSTAKAVGSLGANPTGDVCGVLSMLGTGDFLNGVEAKVQGLLDAIESGASDLEDRARDLLRSVDKAVGISETLNDIQDYVNDATGALQDLADSVSIGGLKDVLATARCLANAAQFTTNHATLLAAQVSQMGANLNAGQVTNMLKQQSLARTGIAGKASSLKSKLTGALDSIGDEI